MSQSLLDKPAPSAWLPAHTLAPPTIAKNGRMRVLHVLRKCNPEEWGGTETAVQQMVSGLRQCAVESVVYAPRLEIPSSRNPLVDAGCAVKHFRAFLPTLGLPRAVRQQRIAVGGNLMSFDLPIALWREPHAGVIHAHALGRLGGIASRVARWRGLPFVVTIHGGYLDLPDALKEQFRRSAARGLDWGKIFDLALRSSQWLCRADAILTCNPNEAWLLRASLPDRRIVVQPHGVRLDLFLRNCRDQAHIAFPQLGDREILLCVGRIDSVKNQAWLVEQAPEIFRRHPKALLVLAGPSTDESYSNSLRSKIRFLGLEEKIVLTGGLPPGDPRLIGLFQTATVVLLPSLSETFGLVLLEAWAARTSVISSRTSGANALVKHGTNGWLFDLGNPGSFHEALDLTLADPALRSRLAAAGSEMVRAQYDTAVVVARLRRLYDELIERKHALRHCAG
jgi:glycosyltransferase involved in cell wall biosynthesis